MCIHAHLTGTDNNVIKARVEGERVGEMGDMCYSVHNKIKGVIMIVFADVT